MGRGVSIQLIVLGFVAVGTFYLFATPPFEASDEIWHYPYVQHLQRGLGLPIQRPRPEDNLARQEGSQPPLYYAVAAAMTFWIDSGQPGSGIVPNPHAVVGQPLWPGNKNMSVQDPGDRWYGAGLAVLFIRAFSLLLGASSVVLVYRLVRLAVPGVPEVALAAASLTAFNPEFVFISASVNNDNLITVLALAALLLGRRVACLPTSGSIILPTALLGLVLGAAALTKLTGLGLLPLAAVCIAIAGWRRRSLLATLVGWIVAFGITATMAGWWYLRNWLLYGEPSGIAMMLRIVNTRNPPPPIWELVTTEFEGFRISYWALFGGVNLLAGKWTYVFFDVLALLSLAGVAIVLVRWINAAIQTRGRRGVQTGGPGMGRLDVGSGAPRGQVGVLGLPYPGPIEPVSAGLMLSWTVIVGISLIRWTQTTLASQGRLLFPAVAGCSVVLAIGLVGSLPRLAARPFTALLTVVLVCVAAAQPLLTILPAYTAPGPLAAIQLSSVGKRLDVDFGNTIRLVGVELPTGAFHAGERVPISITWQLLQPVDREYSVFVHLFGRVDRKVGQFDTYPGLGLTPFSRWRPSEAYRDVYPVLIEYLTEGPILLRVEAGVYDVRNGERLSAEANGQQLGTSPTIGYVKLDDPPAADPPGLPVAADFAGLIAVDGATVTPAERLPSGDSRPPAYALALYLRAQKPIPDDYTIFAQIVDGDRVISQRDGIPVEGRYPTTRWEIGERVIDRREIPLPPYWAPDARIIVGFYDPSSGARLVRRDATGDLLDLGPLRDVRR